MSASPLPAVPLANPVQSSAPRPASTPQQQDGPSFDSHLQDAQQQQSSSTDPSQAPASNADASQGSASQSSSANNTATTASAADANGASTDGHANGNSDTSGADSLATAVLNLIDHTAGHSKDGSASPPAAKPSVPASKQTVNVPHPLLPLAVMPMPLPAVPVPAANVSGSKPTATAVGALTAGKAEGKSGLNARLSAGAQTAFDNAASSADGSGAEAGNANAATTSDMSLSAQGGAQALGNAMAASHAVATAAVSPAGPTTPSSVADVSALGNIAATALPTPLASASGHSLTLNAPVGSSGFAKELGQQITWLSGQDVKQAQIRLNPQDLGPLDVKVSVEHGRVDVAFFAQHPAAAAAVQQGLGQLHQMLGGQGLSLGHATVGQHAQQQSGSQQPPQGQSASSGDAEAGAETPVTSVLRQVAIGLVDAFA